MKLVYENLFGLNIVVCDSVDTLSTFSMNNPGIYVSANAEAIYKQDSDFLRIINNNYGYADGVGAVISSHINGNGGLVKIPGCELWLSVLSKLSYSKVAFIGGDENTIEELIIKIKTEFPSLDIVFYNNGFFKNEELVLSALKELEPQFVFVGMGQPKQEIFCEKAQKLLPEARYFPVGGSFDLYVGKVDRAPIWMIKLSCEWLYRLYKDPSRWRRQLVLPMFLFRCISSRILQSFHRISPK